MLRTGRSVFIAWELKCYGKRASAEQLWWLDFFRQVPVRIDAGVRYPWELDEITDDLLNQD